MLDIETNQPLRVGEDGDTGPYLLLPLDQLEAVQRVLDERGFVYSVSEDAIQLDDSPFIAIVDFARDESAARIQEALDAA